MTIKAIKTITVLTLLCAVFVCFGTVCSEAAARPGRVKGFKAKVIGRNVKLSWAKAGGKVSRYVIYRNGRKIASVGRKTLKYTDKNRKYGKTYRYKVRACRKDVRRYGRWSVIRKALIRPGKVNVLKSTGSSIDQIALSWKKASGAVGYAVYRNGKLAVRTKSTSYTDKGLMPNSEYKYYIKSYAKNGTKYVYGKASKTLKAMTESVSEEMSQVEEHCAQTARDAVSEDDLEYYVDLINNRLQPQAVEMILEKFPGMRNVAEYGEIGRELSFYTYYIKGDDDGEPSHEKVEPYGLQTIGKAGTGEDALRFKYLFVMDLRPFCTEQKDINGYYRLIHSGEPIELLKDRLTGEMLRALMFDYNRTGMIGANQLADVYAGDEGSFPNEELAEKYRKLVFPKWFTEGTVASVENIFRSENDQFQKLRGNGDNDLPGNYINSENGFDLEDNVLSYTSEESCKVSGYLAVLYLAELMYAKENENESSIDESGAVSADRLREGLNRILSIIHDETTLDQIIMDISPVDSEGKRLYSNTEEFEQYFIKGRKDEAGQYTGDQESINFVNSLLDYLESGEGSSEGELAGGSILTDLKASRSPLDENKQQSSDYLHITDSNRLTASTVKSDAASIGAGRCH